MPPLINTEVVSRQEALEAAAPVVLSNDWLCDVPNCEDVTVWLQVQPIPGFKPKTVAKIEIKYFRLTDSGGTLFNMQVNYGRTYWIREIAPLDNDCNVNPGPCVFDTKVDATRGTVAFSVPGPNFYAAAFPCNRLLDCETPLPLAEPVHGIIAWTAPEGWQVRVGADMWVDRDAPLLGTSHVGPWVAGQGPNLVGFSW